MLVRREVKAPRVLDLCIRRRWVVSFSLLLFRCGTRVCWQCSAATILDLTSIIHYRALCGMECQLIYLSTVNIWIHLLEYLLTPRSAVLFEKLTSSHMERQ